MSASAMAELREWLGEIRDLSRVALVLDWDQYTNMPPAGAGARAQQLATVEKIRNQRIVSQRTHELIEAAAAELTVQGVAPDTVTARIVSEARRLHEHARRVPAELAEARAHAASRGFDRWLAAREADDFTALAPALTRNIELARDYMACFPERDDPYDALLEDYVPGMGTAQVEALLSALRDELLPLVRELRGRHVDLSALSADYPVAAQRQVVDRVTRMMGFDDSSWRFDESEHPVQTSFSVSDIRLSTRFIEDDVTFVLYSAMHECGHGLFEAGIDPEIQRTPLGRVRSSALHESQSRLWENMVGRSRAFCEALAPILAEHSGGSLAGLEPERLFQVVNAVRPSPIRLQSDETSYGLHIVVRFELERRLLAGELDVAELPGEWDRRMRECVGVEVRTPREGVLQDVHWGHGFFGYFPAYAIGNMIAAQLWECAHQAIPELDAQLAAAQLGPLREWLCENIYRHGSRYPDGELMQRVVGGPVQAAPFVRYLKDKLSSVYAVELR